jgi:hypothetical protein
MCGPRSEPTGIYSAGTSPTCHPQLSDLPLT